MQQLSGLDASFLSLETPTSHMHIGGVMILDPSTANQSFGFESIKTLIEERQHLIPAFTRKLAPVPLELDFPYWVEDDAFDLDFHVRHIAVPPPGDLVKLQELASRLFSRPLDRSRPLWELYVVEGLNDMPFGIQKGNIALISKMHHAAVDGVSGAEIMATLLDLAPPKRTLKPAKDKDVETNPTPATLLYRTGLNLIKRPLKVIDTLPRAARTAFNMRNTGADAAEVISPLPFTAPRVPWNAHLTSNRLFEMTSLDLRTIKEIKNAAETTMNTVILAIIAGALRNHLSAKEMLPDEPLVVMAPISVRNPDQKGSGGNHVSAMLVSLATQEADARTRLNLIATSAKEGKNRDKAIGADLLQNFADFATPAVAALATRLYTRLNLSNVHSPVFNTVVTNVPGPPIPLYLDGARMVGNFGTAPIIDGMGMIIVVMSVENRLDIGLTVCREVTPDIDDLSARIPEALDELYKAVLK